MNTLSVMRNWIRFLWRHSLRETLQGPEMWPQTYTLCPEKVFVIYLLERWMNDFKGLVVLQSKSKCTTVNFTWIHMYNWITNIWIAHTNEELIINCFFFRINENFWFSYRLDFTFFIYHISVRKYLTIVCWHSKQVLPHISSIYKQYLESEII